MIDRKKLINRHNPVLSKVDSPLSVGNGEFCFTADITGLQTLNETYESNHFPLCTMSNWGWHTAPTQGNKVESKIQGKIYQWDDLELTAYEHAGRTVYYPVEKKPGNAEVYDWLRHNPHKFNLGYIGLSHKNKEIKKHNINVISQELDLYEGTITSRFTLNGEKVEVVTVCDSTSDTIAFKITSQIPGLGVRLAFPYGHHGMSGSDWENVGRHSTTWNQFDGIHAAHRKMDDIEYFVEFNIQGKYDFYPNEHSCIIYGKDTTVCISVNFRKSVIGTTSDYITPDYNTVYRNSCVSWKEFWNTVGLVDFSNALEKESRAMELERRMVLSLYLLKIQAMGTLPPAETGLTVNSWYGRFHSEMYLWNSAFLPLWNLGEKLLPSLEWFYSIIPEAKALAASNGYKGIRWPKQPANTGRDAPSPIAPLLVWQQPNIIYMLELLYQHTFKSLDFLEQHWEMVSGLADFMASILYLDKEKGRYELIAPLIPAQEVFDPLSVKSPMFEMEYFRFGLKLACEWGKRLNKDTAKWRNIAECIAEPVVLDGRYLAHALCPDTYTKYNRDHPMMIGAYGLIISDKVDPSIMKATLEKVLECWEHESMWGWDYAMLAMCATRLGLVELAIDLLLSDTPKNQYVASGNNFQATRTDLPLYLPGNGSLLLALPLLISNLPKEWGIICENII